jgi:hypothetical protein
LKDFFQIPGWWYNFLSFSFGVAGLVLGVIGLWIAYVQLAKTLNAAEAAKQASLKTADDLKHFSVVVDLQKLSSLCREVMNHLETNDFAGASRPLHELRVGLAKLSTMAADIPILDRNQWDAMMAEIMIVQIRTEEFKDGSPTPQTANYCRQILWKTDEQLVKMLPKMSLIVTGGS